MKQMTDSQVTQLLQALTPYAAVVASIAHRLEREGRLDEIPAMYEKVRLRREGKTA